MKLTGAAILVSRGMKVLQAAPAAYPYRSAAEGSGCIMSFWRDWVSWLLVVLAIACFVVGAFPQWSEWVDPANGDKVSECRLGFWSSPVYQDVQRDFRPVVVGQLEVGHKIELGVEQVVGVQVEWKTAGESGPNWLSWSSLVILIGLGSLGILRWRRNAVAGPESQERGIQANE